MTAFGDNVIGMPASMLVDELKDLREKHADLSLSERVRIARFQNGELAKHTAIIVKTAEEDLRGAAEKLTYARQQQSLVADGAERLTIVEKKLAADYDSRDTRIRELEEELRRRGISGVVVESTR